MQSENLPAKAYGERGKQMEAGTNESAAMGNMRMSVFWGQHKALAGVKPTSTSSSRR